jgi:hypothetical protein
VEILNRNFKIFNFDLRVILPKRVLGFGLNYPNANVAQNVAEIKCSEDIIFVANDQQM